MGDRLPSQFRVSQSIKVNFKPNAPLEELWDIHASAMEDFRDILEEVDKGKSIIEKAEPSLLDLKGMIAGKIIEECHLCERRCLVNRRKKEIGYCGVGISRYSSDFLHRGEEPELVPSHTIFFTGCNFSCVYCQNWEISTAPQEGKPALPEELARRIALMRAYGSRNVNFVTPTPHTHIILEVLNAIKINIPTVWNTNMYYSEEVGKLLEGIIDVYLGDFRYGNNGCGKKYSNVDNYWGVVTRNFESAYRSGEILLRQLVIPNHLECCTRPIVAWVKKNIPKVRFNLMFQYMPYYKAYLYPEISRPLTREERERALRIVKEAGIEDLLV